MLGNKLKTLRETSGLMQREVAAELNIDIAYVSKMESNEKPVSRNHLGKLAVLFGISEAELTRLWLADKILKTVKQEDQKKEALQLALKSLR